MIGVLVGIPLGILSSLIAWYILFHLIVPKVRYSEFISKTKTEDNPSGFKYRIKFEIYGNRKIVDAELFIQFRVKGLIKGYPNNWDVVHIPTDNPRRPILGLAKDKLRHITRLHVNRLGVKQLINFPDNIKNKLSKKTLELEDIYREGTSTELKVILFGYDEFSGSRKVFISKEYSINDIKRGSFNPSSLEFMEGMDGTNESTSNSLL